MLIDLLSPYLLHKWKDFLRPVMEHVTIWSDKLKSSLLSHCHHSKPLASSAIMMIFLHWNHCSALPNTILERAGCCSCVTSECLWSVKSSILLYFNLYMKIFLLSRAKFQFMPNFSKFPLLHWFNDVNLMFAFEFYKISRIITTPDLH